MARRILIIDGHPDPDRGHLCDALAQAYAHGATSSGHEVRQIRVGDLEFPLLRTKADFESCPPPPVVADGQEAVRWAEHLLIVFPLWHGTLPAFTKAFLEQMFRPGFGLGYSETGGMPKKLLKGRSARVIVTMGMPVLFYRWYFGAHGVKSLTRNLLGLTGMAPTRTTYIGSVDSGVEHRRKWLERVRVLGAAAA